MQVSVKMPENHYSCKKEDSSVQEIRLMNKDTLTSFVGII